MKNGPKRYTGFRSIKGALDYCTKPILAKKGLAGSRIVSDWESIVGAQMARMTNPRKLYFPKGQTCHGTLEIEVYNSSLAMQMTYIEPMMLEKIATFFGYKAVDRIRLIQKPMDYRQLLAKTKPAPYFSKMEEPDAPIKPELLELINQCEDGDLKASLLSLAKVIGKKTNQTKIP